MLEEFKAAVLDEVRGYPQSNSGLLSDELLVHDGDMPVLIYVSRWTDESALEAFAGPGWRTDPVTFPGEDGYLTEPLKVRHFEAQAAR